MKKRIDRLCISVGLCLLAAAAILLLFWQWGIYRAQQKAENYVQVIRTLLPEAQSAPLEERRDNTMPVLAIDGTDFVGILELPKYGSALPVCADWGEVSQYPCRFGGSAYDRTMQIGATSQKGQYNFYRELSVGDAVFFTDMEGNRFSYEITQIRYAPHADQAALGQETAALTLFIKNLYGLEYVLIFCDPPICGG